MRKDIHRPSEINPQDYEFVCVQYLWVKDDFGEIDANRLGFEQFNAHRGMTGGKFAAIEHGGTCFCCGANARFVARYYHADSNTYVQFGERCAEKVDQGEAQAFRKLRREVAQARLRKAGRSKARVLLDEAGLAGAWTVWQSPSPELPAREQAIIGSVVSRIISSGAVSPKQSALIKNLLVYLANHKQIDAEREAKRQAEKEAAAVCPEGTATVHGVIVSVKAKESAYGVDVKATIKDQSGFIVWGNLPKAAGHLIEWTGDYYGNRTPRLLAKEPRIEFQASITRSSNDAKFGFFKRPTKVRVIEA
jgi:hypothetical protein